MKKILGLILFVFLVTISASVLLAAPDQNADTQSAKFESCGAGPLVGLQGCCSHHGGVSGCQYGRVVCNDGTLSPSCRCP